MVFKDWKEAHSFAQKRANDTGLSQGIEKFKEYGKVIYKVRFLPRQNKCFGSDLGSERVEPERI